MLRLTSTTSRLCDGISRREMMRIGGLSAAGLSLAHLVEGSPASPANVGKAKSCIVLFLMGGPPQQSTWDPKPDAPSQMRGEFAPISTSVPGIKIAETLPRVAQQAHHLAILRAMRTGDNAHSSSGYYMLTGVPHQPMNRENVNPGAPNNWPNFASIVRRFQSQNGAIPASVRIPHHIWNTCGSVWPGQDAGFLGRAHDPWLFRCEPGSADFRIPEFTLPAELTPDTLSGRRDLLGQIERWSDHLHTTRDLDSYDGATRQAFELLTSESARRAFRLDDEPAPTRDRYGRSHFGQSVLMARRLVEAGVRLVQVNWFRGPDEPSDAPCWDSHTKEADRLRNHLAPPFDQAFSALLTDLVDRGMLEETLVVCMAEFGRDPKINPEAGRNHWGNVFSVALAGGGIKGGYVHGSSDAVGGEPKDGLTRPEDLLATLYHQLGLDLNTEYHDKLNRPIPISRGQIIHPIIA